MTNVEGVAISDGADYLSKEVESNLFVQSASRVDEGEKITLINILENQVNLRPVLPDIIDFHDVRMLDEFENGHLPLDSHWNANLAIHLLRHTAIPLAQGSETTVLDQICHSPVNDLDCGELIGDVVTAQTHTSR